MEDIAPTMILYREQMILFWCEAREKDRTKYKNLVRNGVAWCRTDRKHHGLGEVRTKLMIGSDQPKEPVWQKVASPQVHDQQTQKLFCLLCHHTF